MSHDVEPSPGTPAPSAASVPPADRAAARGVTPGVLLASEWSWRLVVIGIAVAAAVWILVSLKEVVVPFLIGLLVCALLQPLVAGLRARRWPAWLAITSTLLATAVVIAGLVLLVVMQIHTGIPTLQREAMARFEDVRDLLAQPPFNVVPADYDALLASSGKTLENSREALLTGALDAGLGVGHLVTGALLAFFTIVIVLIDGRGIWRFVVRVFPQRARPAIDGAGRAGWGTLSAFTRVQIFARVNAESVQIFVAAGNAVGIGIAAWLLGLPLAIPIAVVVFLASFIPVVGAIVSGAFAVVIALVFVGPLQAVIMLVAVIGVHLLESHVLQPLVMGGAVHVHPLAVVLAVAAGSYVGGVAGALFAVPFVATLNVMVRYIAGGSWKAGTPAVGS
jgi:predicted PurR-regulated permease PerM